MRLLFIGDVFGKPGRDLVRRGLPLLVSDYAIDFTIANVENAAAGAGITREIGDRLLGRGVDVMTTGNHVWDRREALAYIGAEPRLLRPANLAAAAPGRGAVVARTADGRPVGVINLMGRVFMPPCDDPFAAANTAVAAIGGGCRILIVDMHAEASAEKVAMGWHLDGRVTAVIGTHTHVQTADARVLPGGTAYLTDAGMTGPHDSVIGMNRDAAVGRFVTGLPARLEPAEGNPRLQGAVIDVDDATGRATGIERIDWPLEVILGRAAGAGDDGGDDTT